MSETAIRIEGTFVPGDGGPICKRPSDSGSWLVPARGVAIQYHERYILEVVREISPRLRAVRVIELAEEAERRETQRRVALVERALEEGAFTLDYNEHVDYYYMLEILGVPEFVNEAFSIIRDCDNGLSVIGPIGLDDLPTFEVTAKVMDALSDLSNRRAKLLADAEEVQRIAGVLAEKIKGANATMFSLAALRYSVIRRIVIAKHPRSLRALEKWIRNSLETFATCERDHDRDQEEKRGNEEYYRVNLPLAKKLQEQAARLYNAVQDGNSILPLHVRIALQPIYVASFKGYDGVKLKAWFEPAKKVVEEAQALHDKRVPVVNGAT